VGFHRGFFRSFFFFVGFSGFLRAVAVVFMGWKTSFVATSGLALHHWLYSVRDYSFSKLDASLPLGRFPLAWSLLWVSPL
jgi:voltage-gated potassium channel Kch